MKKKRTGKKSGTDWARLATMKDRELDFSDLPELTPKAFANAMVRRGLRPTSRKSQLTLRIDQDVVGWFRQIGRGYQTLINQLLRAYMDAAHSK